MNINIEKFKKQFDKEYNFLYESKGYVAGYDEAITAFDEFLKKNGDFIREFARHRNDLITSDREAAAFMFALETFL